MASIQKSRFALLKVEDDEENEQQKMNAANKQSQQKSQKKKNKKKKQQQAENQELKHLAFGVPTKQRGHSADSSRPLTNGSHRGGSGSVSDAQWQQWQKMDSEYAAESFEKDLQQALLLSRLDNEEEKERKKHIPVAEPHKGGGDGKEGKKKKKQTMSLEEFNSQDLHKKSAGDAHSLESIGSPKVPAQESDTKFFDDVTSDVDRILRQEKMQEEYKKQYLVESVITAKYQEEIRKKEKEIDFLRATMKKQEEELQQVKKRNKQLCVILAQGEMKDKAEVLMQVDQLSTVKDELTEQVSELTAELEKERSKVHTLSKDLEKVKSGGGKHK